jgi:hypothetical protein
MVKLEPAVVWIGPSLSQTSRAGKVEQVAPLVPRQQAAMLPDQRHQLMVSSRLMAFALSYVNRSSDFFSLTFSPLAASQPIRSTS